jgi:hypothetical protein
MKSLFWSTGGKKLLVPIALGGVYIILYWVPPFAQTGCQEWVGCIGEAILYLVFGVIVLPIIALAAAFTLMKEKRLASAFLSALFTEVIVIAILLGQYTVHQIKISQNIHEAAMNEVMMEREMQALRPALPPKGVATTLRGRVTRQFVDQDLGSFLDLHIDGDGGWKSRLNYQDSELSLRKCENILPDVAKIQIGDYVEFHAMTIGIGAFSTCESREYYIKVLATSSEQ